MKRSAPNLFSRVTHLSRSRETRPLYAPDEMYVRDTALQANARELNYQKAFVDAIYTANTEMNTQIKGQHGYKKDNIFDKMSEAEKMYNQYKWIIK